MIKEPFGAVASFIVHKSPGFVRGNVYDERSDHGVHQTERSVSVSGSVAVSVPTYATKDDLVQFNSAIEQIKASIDTLAHALKNVDKIIEVREGVEEGSVEAYREFFRQMHNLSDSAPDERTRASINRIIQEMQQG